MKSIKMKLSRLSESVNKENIIFIINISVLIIVVLTYISQIIVEGTGVDILWRVTESKYFINGINPYEVFIGQKPEVKEFGRPAAYAHISYLLVAPLAIINNKYVILSIYSIIDIYCLYAGLKIIRKDLGKNYSILDSIIIVITLISLVNLDHIKNLNYGIVAVYGLILTLDAAQKEKLIPMIIGIILVSLKPSILIPLVILCLMTKEIKIFIWLLIINLFTVVFVGSVVEESTLVLIKQLQELNMHFSRNGFYRWEGLFLFIKNWIDIKLVFVGIGTTLIYMLINKNIIKIDNLSKAIVIITSSLAFFYNQEHAWSMAYIILAYCIYQIKKDNFLLFPLILVLLFMCFPSNYEEIEKLGYLKYMFYHNIIRFTLLLVASGIVLRQIKKEKY